MSVEIKHSNIDLLKMKHQETYSEDVFGIVHAPDYQCKEIDRVIKAIRNIDKLTCRTERLDEDELRDRIDDIERELYDLERDMEEIRSACEGIREWGQGWKDKCKKVINESDIDIETFV